VGSDTITASYGGDSNFTGSSNTTSEAVNQDGTTTSISTNINPSVFGQSVTFTATVGAASPGSGTPTGTVTFLDGTSTLGTATLSGGSASFTTSSLIVASHSITVSYGGDTHFTGSTSGALTQTVNKDGTTTTVTQSSSTSVYGQSVTFTATVAAAAPGSGTPQGTVTFLDGGTTLGTATLSGGTASFTTSQLSVASHSITVKYAGGTSFNSSVSSAIAHPVNKDATTAVVSSSANPSTHGQSVTFTATVTANTPGSGTPTGTVTFMDGNKVLGTVTLNSQGTATFTTSNLSKGTHKITVVYNGDADFLTSTSPVLSQAVK
jgi:hypothetical protein